MLDLLLAMVWEQPPQITACVPASAPVAVHTLPSLKSMTASQQLLPPQAEKVRGVSELLMML